MGNDEVMASTPSTSTDSSSPRSDSIFEALRADHDRQRALAADLLETTGDSDDRRRLFAALRAEMEAHAAQEERHFYVPLFELDLTQDHARHGVAEHKELDDLVEQLEQYDMAGPKWIGTAEHLVDRLLHHVAEEEREFFPVAGKALSDEEKIALAGAYQAGMRNDRTER